MGWFKRGMGRWRWVGEDEDGDGPAEDKDKGWVGEVACMRQRAVCRGVVLGITSEDGFEQGQQFDRRGCAWVLQVECA